MTRVARRRIRPRRSIIFLITSSVVTGLIVLVVLAFSRPASFRELGASILSTAPERARIFERSLVSELTRIRKPEAEWGIRIREDDLNAWLWVRLPQWMSHVGADGEVDLWKMQAVFESNRILITSPGGVLAFKPMVTSEGLLIEPRPGGSLGRLPVPSSLVLLLGSGLDLDRMLTSFGGLASEGNALPRRFALGDGRVVEILETRLDDDELVLVFRTRSSGISKGL